MLIIFLGRNTEGILRDARKAFPEEWEVIVISRDGDALTPPEGVECVPVSRFSPKQGESYTVVANGGTTAQCLVVLRKLLESGASFGVWDIQPDGVTELWPWLSASNRAGVIAARAGEKLASRLTEEEARRLYFETAW